MNLRDLFEINVDDPNATTRELWLKLVAMVLRAVAGLVILLAVVRAWSS